MENRTSFDGSRIIGYFSLFFGRRIPIIELDAPLIGSNFALKNTFLHQTSLFWIKMSSQSGERKQICMINEWIEWVHICSTVNIEYFNTISCHMTWSRWLWSIPKSHKRQLNKRKKRAANVLVCLRLVWMLIKFIFIVYSKERKKNQNC